MAQATLASNATIPTLSRGQKAAQTRRENTARREAEAAAEATAKADHMAALKKRAAKTVRMTVPTKAARAASLAKLKAEQKAQKAEAAAKAKAAHAYANEQSAIDAQEKAFSIMSRHELRALAVGENLKGEAMGRRYARKLTADFDIPGGWWNAKRADISDSNVGKTIAALFAEQKIYFDNFKAEHLKLVQRGLRKGRANPSRYWGLAQQYAQDDAASDSGDSKGRGKGALSPLDAYKRDLPTLYIRANGHPDFEGKGPAAERLRDAAFKIGEACAMILTKAQWSDVQAKAEAKAVERTGK